MRIDPHRGFGTRECPGCEVEVEANQNSCPVCGYMFPHPDAWQRGMRLWGALIMLGLILFLLLALFL